MLSKAETPQQYLDQLAEQQKDPITNLRNIIVKNLPLGFTEILNYGMIGYVVPHSIYPNGYHCNPKKPLPFMALAAQKKHISIHHLGIYASETLTEWLKAAYTKEYDGSLDIGKGCIRFKYSDYIPLNLIGQLAAKLTVENWIEIYEREIKN